MYACVALYIESIAWCRESVLAFITHNCHGKHMLRIYWSYFRVSLISVLNANLCCPVNSKQVCPSPALVAIHLLMNLNKTFKEQLWLGISLAAFSASSFQAMNFLPAFAGHWREKNSPRFWQEAQDAKEKEKERPQWASEASVSICPVFQRHTGCN